MNDTLRYMHSEPVHRQFHHHDMTFGLALRFSENFILPQATTRVVRGKLIAGQNARRRLAEVCQPAGLFWLHATPPRQKLLFAGGEFAQGVSGTTTQAWTGTKELECHSGISRLVGISTSSIANTRPCITATPAPTALNGWMPTRPTCRSSLIGARPPTWPRLCL